jgi:hypothetical protein
METGVTYNSPSVKSIDTPRHARTGEHLAMTRRTIFVALCGLFCLGSSGVTAAEMAAAPITKASFPLFHHHHRQQPVTTMYVPQPVPYTAQYAPAPACQSCVTTCTQRVCQYVPQTCYRLAYQNVPVTTMRPVTTTDPCTGCTTTCMRPFTYCVQRAHYVPYTTYSLSCQNVTTTTPTAQPMAASYAPAATACSGCTPTSGAYPASPYLPATPSMPAIQSAPSAAPTVAPPGPTTNGGLPAPVLNGQATGGAASWPRVAPPAYTPNTTTHDNPPLRPLVAPPDQSRERTAVVTPPRAWQYTGVQWPAATAINPAARDGWAAAR